MPLSRITGKYVSHMSPTMSNNLILMPAHPHNSPPPSSSPLALSFPPYIPSSASTLPLLPPHLQPIPSWPFPMPPLFLPLPILICLFSPYVAL